MVDKIKNIVVILSLVSSVGAGLSFLYTGVSFIATTSAQVRSNEVKISKLENLNMRLSRIEGKIDVLLSSD